MALKNESIFLICLRARFFFLMRGDKNGWSWCRKQQKKLGSCHQNRQQSRYRGFSCRRTSSSIFSSVMGSWHEIQSRFSELEMEIFFHIWQRTEQQKVECFRIRARYWIEVLLKNFLFRSIDYKCFRWSRKGGGEGISTTVFLIRYTCPI